MSRARAPVGKSFLFGAGVGRIANATSLRNQMRLRDATTPCQLVPRGKSPNARSLEQRRRLVCILRQVFDGALVVAGGLRDGERLASAEAFRPAVGRWEALPPMPHAAWQATAAVCRGLLLVAGGVACAELQACSTGHVLF